MKLESYAFDRECCMKPAKVLCEKLLFDKVILYFDKTLPLLIEAHSFSLCKYSELEYARCQ